MTDVKESCIYKKRKNKEMLSCSKTLSKQRTIIVTLENCWEIAEKRWSLSSDRKRKLLIQFKVKVSGASFISRGRQSAIRSAVRRDESWRSERIPRFRKKSSTCATADSTMRRNVKRWSRGREVGSRTYPRSNRMISRLSTRWFVRSLLAGSRSIAIFLKSFCRPLPRNGPTIEWRDKYRNVTNLLSECS